MILVVILRRILSLIITIILLPVWIIMMIVDAVIGATHTQATLSRIWR